MTTPFNSQPTLPSLPFSLSNIHNHLLESGLYLGDCSVQENIVWVQDGKSHKLAIKSSIPSAEDLATAHDSDTDE